MFDNFDTQIQCEELDDYFDFSEIYEGEQL